MTVIASSRATRASGSSETVSLATVNLRRPIALLALAGTLLLELQAMWHGYGLRVTSDTPTYLALLRDVALHPFQPVSPFVAVPGVETSHATPDMQALALVWRQVSPTRSLIAPVAAYHVLAIWGMIVTLLVGHSLFIWVRGVAGSRAAWISIPVLLGLLGPANVIWAGDLSFHGFLYGSYFSQTFAIALLLYGLHFVPRATTRVAQAGAVALVALLLLVHPFTGVLFVFLVTCQAAARAWRQRPGWEGVPWILGLAFVLGLAWPAYSLSAAMTVSGISGTEIIIGAVVTPMIASHTGRLIRLSGIEIGRLRPPSLMIPTGSGMLTLAIAGVAIVCFVAGWEEWLATRQITDPLHPTNHLAIYWDERLVRWPLLFGTGLVGLAGLAQLSRRSSRLPAFWFSVCLGIGLAGAVGVPFPLWNRILLFCQLPLAAGTAIVIAQARWRTKSIVIAGFAASAAVRLLFLFYTPSTITYYPAMWIPAGYTLGVQIPSTTQGVVAADPYTSYYVPGATGHSTLLISKSHVGSSSELDAATTGYALLHRLYAGRQWHQAVRELWRRGVRFVIVDHRVVLRDTTLARFSTDTAPFWTTRAQRRQLGRYFARLNLLGHVVADTPQYVIYKLDATKVRWEAGR
jgi:hypothetical protein